MGSVRYEGENLQAILPWLRLAEWLHVGNKTTFGLGACRVTPHE
jgi:CRISPR/Cas system endoribonuclease Cas6 (RAMP superfamily)